MVNNYWPKFFALSSTNCTVQWNSLFLDLWVGSFCIQLKVHVSEPLLSRSSFTSQSIVIYHPHILAIAVSIWSPALKLVSAKSVTTAQGQTHTPLTGVMVRRSQAHTSSPRSSVRYCYFRRNTCVKHSVMLRDAKPRISWPLQCVLSLVLDRIWKINIVINIWSNEYDQQLNNKKILYFKVWNLKNICQWYDCCNEQK